MPLWTDVVSLNQPILKDEVNRGTKDTKLSVRLILDTKGCNSSEELGDQRDWG